MLALQTRQNHYMQAEVTIRDFPQRRNPLAFDVARWLKSDGIQVVGQLDAVSASTHRTSRLDWLWWRAAMNALLERSVREDVRPLFKAILLGDKGEMDREVRTAFSRAGLSHLMAVSGMHVGFVLMPVWLIIPLFWVRESGKALGLAIIAIILLFLCRHYGFFVLGQQGVNNRQPAGCWQTVPAKPRFFEYNRCCGHTLAPLESGFPV